MAKNKDINVDQIIAQRDKEAIALLDNLKKLETAVVIAEGQVLRVESFEDYTPLLAQGKEIYFTQEGLLNDSDPFVAKYNKMKDQKVMTEPESYNFTIYTQIVATVNNNNARIEALNSSLKEKSKELDAKLNDNAKPDDDDAYYTEQIAAFKEAQASVQKNPLVKKQVAPPAAKQAPVEKQQAYPAAKQKPVTENKEANPTQQKVRQGAKAAFFVAVPAALVANQALKTETGKKIKKSVTNAIKQIPRFFVKSARKKHEANIDELAARKGETIKPRK